MEDDFEPYAETPKSGQRGSHNIPWEDRLNKVRKFPMGWYCIAELTTKASSASSMAHYLRTKFPDFQFKSGSDKAAGKFKVYACLKPV